MSAGVHKRRISGADGQTWPAQRGDAPAVPKPPVMCFLYEDLASPEPEPIFGQYPRGFIAKVLPWLRCERREVLHVCSGALSPGEGLRVDIRQGARPDVRADGRALPFRSSSVKAVLIDPPYARHYAEDLYGVEYPRPSRLLFEAARVVRPGGRVAIVHYITPAPAPGLRAVKIFGLSTGFDYPMRAVTIFEREQERLL